ncbi:MAG: 2-phosphosulfolactate phosphatase [Lachnospiraceae bacterium]|nr:2-phosphosulfolactate phosphatase [Lachnospiraceae bacterium]
MNFVKIELLQLIEGARQARGLTVIIDVFRAFSVECTLYDAGVREVLAVGRTETARRLKEEHPEYILVGERGGVILPGFDFGNSPSQIRRELLPGRTVVHTTSAGTQGIVNAAGASEIVTGSLVNARAVASYIRERAPEDVSLVCMGLRGEIEAPEDVLCGRYIRSLLTGEALDWNQEMTILREKPSARKFFDPEKQAVFPEADYWMCTDRDRFDFVLQVTPREEDVFSVRRLPGQADGRREAWI